MRRVFLILLLFFLTFIKIQNDGVVNAQACSGVGNYCVGRVVQSWGDGCIQEGGQCNPRWTSIHTYNCAPNTCTTNVFTRDFGGICNTSSCTANSYPDWTELSCCLYGNKLLDRLEHCYRMGLGHNHRHFAIPHCIHYGIHLVFGNMSLPDSYNSPRPHHPRHYKGNSLGLWDRHILHQCMNYKQTMIHIYQNNLAV